MIVWMFIYRSYREGLSHGQKCLHHNFKNGEHNSESLPIIDRGFTPIRSLVV